ncbi:ABC transporter ATP-binding protein [Aerococcaceae bacterium WGS1372]
MKQLLKYFNGYRLSSIFGPMMKLMEALLELLVPMIVALIIDEAIPTGETGRVIRYIFIMFGLAFLSLFFSISAQFLSAKAAVGFTKNLKDDLYDIVIHLPKSVYNTISPASMITRLTSDSFQIQSGLNIFFRLLLRSPFIVFGSLILASQIDRRMTVIFVTMIILLFIIVGGIILLSNPMFSRIRSDFDQLVSLTREQMQGMRVIRAFNQTQREVDEFKEHNRSLTKEQIKVGFVNAFTSPLTYVVVNVALIIVIWQGGGYIHAGSLTQGQLVALVNYLLAILVELLKLTFVITQMTKSYASAKRVVELFEEPTESEYFENKEGKLADNDTIIRFEDVSFTYPDSTSPSLSDIHFSIKKNDFIGIIGSTGSGKSTLLQLITKTFDPSSGDIVYNEKLLDTTNRHTLRQAMSVVPSKIALFKGTIRSNLLMANPDASEEMMWQALEDAQALDFVSKYPEGLDKEVAVFGRNFSGGQRQRLTIARALIKPSSILIFDDSTSALDYVTEANFQRTLKEGYSDRTIIMISQRTHSLQLANNIVVLEEGQQIGFATHEELLETNAVYQEIHQSQQVKEAVNNGKLI